MDKRCQLTNGTDFQSTREIVLNKSKLFIGAKNYDLKIIDWLVLELDDESCFSFVTFIVYSCLGGVPYEKKSSSYLMIII